MKHHIMFIISLSLLTACGRTHQAATPDDNNQMEDLDQLPQIAEQNPTVDTVPPAGTEPQTSEGEAPAGDANSEAIVPPTAVTGAYMVARVVASTETRVTIGLTAYYKGVRVGLKPESYRTNWAISKSLDPNVTALLSPSTLADHDMLVDFDGDSLKAITAQLPIVQVALSVSDLLLNKTEDLATQSVEAALIDTAKRDGKEPAVIEAMPLDPNL